MSGGEGKTLLIEALEAVATSNPQQTLQQWLTNVEQQFPLIAKQLYPALRDEDDQMPLLLDFGVGH